MQSLAATNEVCSMPVFRPLIGVDKQEIIDVAEKIDTYETSILPFEDCCTIFVAKHPVTKPSLNVIHNDEKKHEETVDGRTVPLTLKEFELLEKLMRNEGIVLTRDQLLTEIWGYDFDGETRTVDVHIRTLRQKLGEKGEIIQTVRGVGYRIGGSA